MTTTEPAPATATATATAPWRTAPTRTVTAAGTTFAYRELGPHGGTPLVLLHHFTATLDDWDPRVLDGLAARHHVIAFDNRGVGGSGGKVPHTMDAMAADAIAVMRALGHGRVDLLGFSLGGGVAQEVALQAPRLVRRLILTGTGHRGGGGLTRMPLTVGSAYLKAALGRVDPRHFLFFPRNADGKRVAREYIARLDERTPTDRVPKISHQARIAQLIAIRETGLGTPHDLGRITQPTFVANGEDDVMVSTSQSRTLAERIPDSRLTIYPDSGHGGIFQHHETFVAEVLAFLAEADESAAA